VTHIIRASELPQQIREVEQNRVAVVVEINI